MTWYSTDWSYRKLVTINASCIIENNTNIPILYKISGIGRKSLSNGTDIIFVDSDDTTRLHHELISFSNFTGNAWIQIPSIIELTNKDFYMYYGNLTGGDQTAIDGYKPSSTWDDTFVFVCHMKDSSDNKHLTDSTKWQVPLWKSVAGDPQMVKSFLGSSQKWDNDSSAFISSNTFDGLSTITTETSLEVIISGTGIKNSETFGYLFGIHNKPTDTGLHGTWLYLGKRGNNSVYYKISSSEYIAYSPAVLSQPYWPSTNIAHTEQISCSWKSSGDEPSVNICIAGNILYDYSTAGVGTLGTNWAGIYIGQRPADSGRSFSGSAMEIRLSNVQRNYGWFITTNYNISSLSAGKNHIFYTIASEEGKPTTSTVSSFYWDRGFPKKIDNNNFYWDKGLPIVYISGMGAEAPPAGDLISFYTMSGSATGWGWAKAKVNVTYVPRSPTGDGTGWSWGIVDGTATMYIPSGQPYGWKWCSETAGI